MAISALDFKFLQDTLIRIGSIRLEDGKKELVETRLGRLCSKEGFPSIEAFFLKLRSDTNGLLSPKLIEAMTTHETYFFRDVHPFEALKNTIIPDLMNLRKKERNLRIWCSACSTGQEPYSLAILIQENFPELAAWSVEILGTDICSETLAKAQIGAFTGFETARGLSELYQTRYFDYRDKHWVIRDNIRSKVRFRKMNLLETWTLIGQYDLIFIRNVLIYFDDTEKKKILVQAEKILKPDGYLMLGVSETTLNLNAELKTETIGLTNVFRHAQKPQVK